MTLDLNRRSLLAGGIASLFCAPSIVRAASLMPVRSFSLIVEPYGWVTDDRQGIGVGNPSLRTLTVTGVDQNGALISEQIPIRRYLPRTAINEARFTNWSIADSRVLIGSRWNPERQVFPQYDHGVAKKAWVDDVMHGKEVSQLPAAIPAVPVAIDPYRKAFDDNVAKPIPLAPVDPL